MKIGLFWLSLLIFSGSALAITQKEPLTEAFLKNRPKLVLVIAIDQFRSDYLTRFQDRFLPASANSKVGGFGYLMKKGAYFPFGQYDMLQNMTGPGHATILSGAYPYQSGISLNYWYDTKTGKEVYCAEDEKSTTVGISKAKPHVGTSPRNSFATTVGDELKNAGYASKVISIALKDRASIYMGGHRADLSLWFDSDNFKWVSSDYYLPEGKLPEWVAQLNNQVGKEEGKVGQWKVSGPPTGLSTENGDIKLGRYLKPDFGTKFPHAMHLGTKEVLNSPLGATITVDAAEKAIEAYGLGKGKGPDLLAVSFSSHDYVGHAFGPNSLEMEEMTLAEDQMLSRLFNYVNAKVPGGLQNVLIVLTADHGIPPSPELLQKARIDAGRVDEKKLADEMNVALLDKFGKPSSGKWVEHVEEMNFYLNPKAFGERKVARAEVEATFKELLKAKVPALAQVITSSDYDKRILPPGMFERQAKKTYFPGRSGDVIGLLRPFYFSGDATVTHMTGYSYDRTVPLMFVGRNIRPGVFSTPAEVVDIAPTLAFLLGTIPPNLSEGRVLSEILK